METQEKSFGYHRKHHSKQMTVADNGYSAFKFNPEGNYAHGVVYSDQPVKGDCEFEVKITSYGTSWSGNIKLGIMRCQGQISSNTPRYSLEALNHYVWTSNEFCSHTGGILQKSSYGSMSLDNLKQGDRVGFHISEGGDLSYSVNGDNQGVAMRGVYEQGWNVYIVVDHYGNCTATRITKASLGSSKCDDTLHLQDKKIQQLKDQLKDSEEALAEFQQVIMTLMESNQSFTQDNKKLLGLGSNDKEIQQLKDQLKDFEEAMAEFQKANVTLTESNKSLIQTVQKLQLDNNQYKQLIQANQPHWVIPGSEVKITQEVLGKGSWGEIKVAMFRGTRVAAKCLHEIILSEYNLELFSREMEIAARVRHPNLLQFIGATRETPPIILSEIMPTSLYKELQKNRFTQPQIIRISRHVALALNYLHLWKPQPIIHRDISSPNILLEAVGSGQWKAKVCDYGSANLQHQVKTERPGNPSYAAPESHYPDEHSPAMDVYSYGVLLTEMIICRPPDITIAGRLQQVERIEWLPMKSLVQQCVKYNRKERFNMNLVLDILKQM